MNRVRVERPAFGTGLAATSLSGGLERRAIVGGGAAMLGRLFRNRSQSRPASFSDQGLPRNSIPTGTARGLAVGVGEENPPGTTMEGKACLLIRGPPVAFHLSLADGYYRTLFDAGKTIASSRSSRP